MRKIPKIHLIGCRLQEAAATIKEANERMSQTCDICSRRGVGNCRHCVVLDTHHYVVSALKAIAEIEKCRRNIMKQRTYTVKGTITLDMQIKERRCNDVKGYI